MFNYPGKYFSFALTNFLRIGIHNLLRQSTLQ